MEDRSENLHSFYASLVCASAKVSGTRIEQAFRAVKREPFVGPGPWLITLGGHDYVTTPNDDPAFIYQNTLVALDSAQHLNIGMPSAHAYWLGACELKEGETVLTGLVEDRSALFGVVAQIEALGLDLLELRQITPTPAQIERITDIR